MKTEVVIDAINTYNQIQKDLEGFLGKIVSGSETAAEDTITAIKARITNIRDFLVPELKKVEATATAVDAVVASVEKPTKAVKASVVVPAAKATK